MPNQWVQRTLEDLLRAPAGRSLHHNSRLKRSMRLLAAAEFLIYIEFTLGIDKL